MKTITVARPFSTPWEWLFWARVTETQTQLVVRLLNVRTWFVELTRIQKEDSKPFAAIWWKNIIIVYVAAIRITLCAMIHRKIYTSVFFKGIIKDSCNVWVINSHVLDHETRRKAACTNPGISLCGKNHHTTHQVIRHESEQQQITCGPSINMTTI